MLNIEKLYALQVLMKSVAHLSNSPCDDSGVELGLVQHENELEVEKYSNGIQDGDKHCDRIEQNNILCCRFLRRINSCGNFFICFVKYILCICIICLFANIVIMHVTLSNCEDASSDICEEKLRSAKRLSFIYMSLILLLVAFIYVLPYLSKLVSRKNKRKLVSQKSSSEDDYLNATIAQPRPEFKAAIEASITGKVSFVVSLVEDAIREKRGLDLVSEVVCVFLSMKDPVECLRFKNRLDRSLRSLNCSLYHLVYVFMDLKSREKVLNHIEEMRFCEIYNQEISYWITQERRAFVVSDMDDTLTSTFKDSRFPFNTLYPGVQQFFHELIINCSGPSDRDYVKAWSHAKHQVTFITARPSFLNAWTKNDLRKHGFETSVALTGSSSSFLSSLTMLERKIQQFRDMKRLYPEGVFFLVGDNGQRDIDLGKKLLNDGLVTAVYIHDIFKPLSVGDPELVVVENSNNRDRSETPIIDKNYESSEENYFINQTNPVRINGAIGSIQIDGLDDTATSSYMKVLQSEPDGFRKNECTEHGITLFRSYAGAALAAMQQGYFGIESILNVSLACADDLSNISFKHEAQHCRQRDVFLHDVARICHSITYETDAVRFLRDVFDRIAKQ